MSRYGLIEALGGVRFFNGGAAPNFVGLRPPTSGLSGNIVLTLLNSLPGAGIEALTIDSTGQIGRAPLGGGGTVTSVGLSAPGIFSVSGQPVTASGTLTLTLVSQTANTVWAAPDGSNGNPTFRLLSPNDIPSLLAAKISNFDSQVRASRLDQMALPTTSVNLNNQAITNLATPSNASDAATKGYVDATATGLDIKASVRAASTANLASITYAATGGTSARGQITAAPNTIDGVSLAAGNRVLLKNQSTGAQNGIWVVSTVGTGSNGVWDRATDFDQDTEVTSGAFTFVEEGTINGNTGWTLSTTGTITVGGASGTALTFTQFSGAGTYTAGNGLSLLGGQFRVLGTANRITVSGSGVDIASNYAGQNTISILGTISTGVWNGTAIALAHGGTGASNAADARNNLGAAGVTPTTFTNANLVAGTFTFAHGFSRTPRTAHVTDDTGRVVYPDEVTFTSTNCTVDVTSFGTLTGTWGVDVIA